jgi:outer membrane immunogenic protein
LDYVNFRLRNLVPPRLLVPDFNLLGNKTMKRLFLASVAIVEMSAPSFAADLAARPYTKAPAPFMSPATNWSGFYIGAMGGYGWSDHVSASVPGVGGVTFNTDELKGGFGGGTLGYNWQMGSWVLGVEADAAWSDLKYSQSAFGVTLADKIQSFGSVTGRIGYVPTNSVLVYFKGGYAWADNQISATGLGAPFAESRFHSGWTAGGGLEWMFAPAWSAKAEYMYADFSKERYGAAIVPPGVDLGASIHTVKVGVNYHFGWSGPVSRY